MVRDAWHCAWLLVFLPVLSYGSDRLEEKLADKIARQYQAVSSFKATVLMSATVTEPETRKVKHYPGMVGAIVFRKPSDMRVSALHGTFPVKVFDLVSKGNEFRLHIPRENRFVVGRNEVRVLSAKPLENLRPQHFLDAILPRPVDPSSEKMVVEEAAEGGSYVLDLGSRVMWFDRTTLQMTRLRIFDDAGQLLTDARYGDWQESQGIPVSKRIEINRPQEAYDLVILIQAVEFNAELSDEMFMLERPPGAQLVPLGKLDPPPRCATPR